MINVNGLLVEQAKIVQGLTPISPSTSTPDYVSLENYHRLTVIISVNNATTVTGSAITLKQNSALATSGEAALAFTEMWANLDISASDTLVKTTVAANTFTTVTTNNVDAVYVIEVKAEDLDEGNFGVRVGTGDVSNTVLSVVYILWPAKYGKATPPAAITA